MARNNVWMSVSDLMTGLMIIFLFIAIAYIKRVQNNQSVLNEYVENRSVLHDKLAEEFRKESDEGQMTIKGDLSMRFENAETLFPSGSSSLSSTYREILSDVMPRYLNILLNDTMRDKIREIRIEGHTDSNGEYFYNMQLSQDRTRSVLQYCFNLMTEEEILWSKRLITANGLSSSQPILIKGIEDKDLSRRVEFRVRTNAEKKLEEIANSDFLKK